MAPRPIPDGLAVTVTAMPRRGGQHTQRSQYTENNYGIYFGGPI